jgi:hypothetical protein
VRGCIGPAGVAAITGEIGKYEDNVCSGGGGARLPSEQAWNLLRLFHGATPVHVARTKHVHDATYADGAADLIS